MAAKNEVAEVKNALPAHLQGAVKTTKIGNVDSSDRIIPRIKLLQAISPELDAFNNAKKGEFWHTVANESLGASLKAVPIIMRKSFVLWAPRNDDRGILARAVDGIHWDQPAGIEFTVKPKGSAHNVTYVLGDTVHERIGGQPALSEFGSSIPGDPKSPPAAALTYQFLWFFPDYPEFSPAIILNTRSSVKPAKDLLSKIDMRPVDHYAQQYLIEIRQEQGDEGPFFNYTYKPDGYADEQTYNVTKTLYEEFEANQNWAPSDESEDTDKDKLDNSRPKGNADSNKF